MKVEGRTCYRYHRGVDGRGTCDDGCQWFIKGEVCPYWWDIEEEWETYKKLREMKK